jgi:hypothetical protein
MITKNKDVHQLRKSCIMISPFLKGVAERVSKDSGNNHNNRSSISHGIQILLLREAERKGAKINAKELYTA